METKRNIIKEYSYDALGNRKTLTFTDSGTTVMNTTYVSACEYFEIVYTKNNEPVDEKFRL